MILSKKRLIEEQQVTGFRQEMIEKVSWLIQILNNIAEDSVLKTKLVLKGGTALNLFHFNLPRISVDADLNYVGELDRESMLQERPEIELRLRQLLQRLGLTLVRNPQVHAGGKMIWRYPSALGGLGNIEIDLNFMYRVPLLPVEKKDSIMFAGQKISQMPLLDIHELAAGKLAALLDRSVGRDVFDAYHLFRNQELEIKKLRPCFVAYVAMSRKKNFLMVEAEEIDVDRKDLKNKLIPVLKQNYIGDFSSVSEWVHLMLQEVRVGYKKLLPFNDGEKLFIKNIRENGIVQPELFVDEQEMINRVKSHPALLWAARFALT